MRVCVFFPVRPRFSADHLRRQQRDLAVDAGAVPSLVAAILGGPGRWQRGQPQDAPSLNSHCPWHLHLQRGSCW